GGAALKVYPREEALRRLVRPLETQPYSGDEVSRRRGEGIEFADMRPFAFGDPLRHINWRASARRGQLWVNERHPERNTDVVIFLDTFAEARRGSTGTLDLALRAAATLTARYVRRRDRVGFVSFGGVLRWLQPGTGLAQLYRMVDALLDTEIWLNYAWKDLDVVPARTLPPQALVIALTPLLDAAVLALHPALAADRWVWAVSAVGAAAVTLLACALALRWPTLLAWSLALLGAEYAVWLTERGGAVDTRSPLYAAGLLLVAE